MKRFAIKIGYLGSNFQGSQFQPNAKTVEGTVRQDLTTVCNMALDDMEIRLASRTDRGVNALGNVVTFNSILENEDILLRALNAISDSIFYRAIVQVPSDFNTRYAKQRVYRYILRTDGLDIDLIKKCAALFVGEHDFDKFCHADGKPTVLNMESITVEEGEGYVIIEFRSLYYLWNMIRRIVAAIESVGKGRSTLDDVVKTLNGANMTFGLAQPENLTLSDVTYPDLEFIPCPEEYLIKRRNDLIFSETVKTSFYKEI